MALDFCVIVSETELTESGKMQKIKWQLKTVVSHFRLKTSENK